MAHLLVTNETVVIDQPHQENIGSKGSGKHKRASHDDARLTCFEESINDVTKRRALAPITNQPDRLLGNPSRHFGGSAVFKNSVPSLNPNLSYNSSLVSLLSTLGDPVSTSYPLPMHLQLSATRSTLDELLDYSSFLSCDEAMMKPIGSEVNSGGGSKNTSRMSLSVTMSSSFRSMESSGEN